MFFQRHLKVLQLKGDCSVIQEPATETAIVDVLSPDKDRGETVNAALRLPILIAKLYTTSPIGAAWQLLGQLAYTLLLKLRKSPGDDIVRFWGYNPRMEGLHIQSTSLRRTGVQARFA